MRECRATTKQGLMPTTVIKTPDRHRRSRHCVGSEDSRWANDTVAARMTRQPVRVEVDAAGAFLLPGMIDDRAFPRTRLNTRAPSRLNREPRLPAGSRVVWRCRTAIRKRSAKRRYAINMRGQRAFRSRIGRFISARRTTTRSDQVCRPTPRVRVKVFMGASTGNMLVDNP